MEADPNAEIRANIGRIEALTNAMPTIAWKIEIDPLLCLSRVVRGLGKAMDDLDKSVAWLQRRFIEEGGLQEPTIH